MKARIYQPSKSATQSAKFSFWLLEFNSSEKPNIDDKMLWISSSDTKEKLNPNLMQIIFLQIEKIPGHISKK